jgi:hypothetical protein
MIIKTLTSKIICVLSLALCISLIASTCVAATYYVDKNHSSASDSNSGTEANPFKTFQQGVNKAMAGDTVFVKAGDYFEYVALKNSGKAGAPITFKNYMNDVVAIDGSKHSYTKTVYWNPSQDYIIWDGIDVKNSQAGGMWVTGNYNTILNSKIYNNGTSRSTTGLTVTNANNTIIRYNEFINNSWNGCSIESSTNTTLEYNIARDNKLHFGMQLFHDTSTPARMWQNNNVRYNIIYNNDAGFYSRYQENNEITDNLIFNNNSSGIMIAAQLNQNISTYEGHTLIANNTIVNNKKIGIDNEVATHLKIKNNIIAYSTYDGVRDRRNSSAHEINNNIYYKNGSIGAESNALTGDPLFTDMASYDFSLREGSPAIDAGEDLSPKALTDSKDIEGTPRPKNAGFDIGAYEFGVATGEINPPTNLKIQYQ